VLIELFLGSMKDSWSSVIGTVSIFSYYNNNTTFGYSCGVLQMDEIV